MKKIATQSLLAIVLAALAFNTFGSEIYLEQKSPITEGTNLSASVGIETLGGVFTPILSSGCELPCTVSNIFSTAEDNQSQLILSIFRGNAQLTKDATSLGKYQITNIAPAPRGEPQIEVSFIASRGALILRAVDLKGVSELRLIKLK